MKRNGWASRLTWLTCVAWCAATGCGKASREGVVGAGSYGPPRWETVRTNLVEARPPVKAATSTNALLSLIQTELSPATLWHSRADAVTVFANLPAHGLGGPTFLAYSSPTGITSLKPGSAVDGTQVRENWLLAGFPGAEGWTNWDSPWAVFLQRRPLEVRLETNGVAIRFAGPAGHFSLMPLYGAYKPPQKGQEVLKKLGLKEKELLTWEWPTVVARDPLTRLRYWAGVTRRFPVHGRDEIRVDAGADAVTFRQKFEYLEVPDEWGTKPISVAPVSPTLGLAMSKGQSFPVRFSTPPFDFEIATPFGPYLAVPNATEYEMTFPLLGYVHETELPTGELPADAPEVARQALERLRSVAREEFRDPSRFRPDGGWENVGKMVAGGIWYARALPYLDAATRSNAVASLGRHLREDVLVPRRFVERERSPGSGRKHLVVLEGANDAGTVVALRAAEVPASRFLPFVWAYTHYSGDHGLVRERWPLIRQLFTDPARTRWAGFGPDGITELGAQAAPAMAFARLAYLAGDREAYALGCAMAVRDFAHLYVKQRGTAWFREFQPWHSMEPMDEPIYLTHLQDGAAGWWIDGPRFPTEAGPRRHADRWAGFNDLDVARFFREKLGADVARELKLAADLRKPESTIPDGALAQASWAPPDSLLTHVSPTNLASLGEPERFAGPPSAVLSRLVSILRSTVPPRREKLIPDAPAGEFELGMEREAAGPNPFLVQDVVAVSTNGPIWPRMVLSGWQTPTGQPWTVGEVRAGEAAVPASAAEVSALNWNTVRRDWR